MEKVFCPICFHSIKPIQMKRLRCVGEHVFHMKCAWKWLVNNPTCPMCRDTVSSYPEPFCPFNEYVHYIDAHRAKKII